jgi:hypothetical protein
MSFPLRSPSGYDTRSIDVHNFGLYKYQFSCRLVQSSNLPSRHPSERELGSSSRLWWPQHPKAKRLEQRSRKRLRKDRCFHNVCTLEKLSVYRSLSLSYSVVIYRRIDHSSSLSGFWMGIQHPPSSPGGGKGVTMTQNHRGKHFESKFSHWASPTWMPIARTADSPQDMPLWLDVQHLL